MLFRPSALRPELSRTTFHTKLDIASHDHILQDLVHRVPEMQATVGVRRTIVQDERTRLWPIGPLPLIEVVGASLEVDCARLLSRTRPGRRSDIDATDELSQSMNSRKLGLWQSQRRRPVRHYSTPSFKLEMTPMWLAGGAIKSLGLSRLVAACISCEAAEIAPLRICKATMPPPCYPRLDSNSSRTFTCTNLVDNIALHA